MTQIFLLLMLISMPGQPSVKYTASIYATEYQCAEAQIGFQMGKKNGKKQRS